MILIIVLVLSILFTILTIMFYDKFDIRECLSYICVIWAIIGWTIFIIMGSVAIINNMGGKGVAAGRAQLHDSLVYQLENNLYDNDNDIGKQELYEKITEWNTDVARGKALQHDLWIGIFYPNIYDDFEFIKLPESMS